jgi:hypothetical protein
MEHIYQAHKPFLQTEHIFDSSTTHDLEIFCDYDTANDGLLQNGSPNMGFSRIGSLAQMAGFGRGSKK